jgi:integrase
VGRTRKNNPLGLPKRTYWKHGRGWYVHRDGRWEDLGTDIAEIKRKGCHYGDSNCTYGTMAYYLDGFILHCEIRIGLPKSQHGISIRTYEDYKRDAEPLKAFFGKMTPLGVEPVHVGKYLDLGAKLGRPIRANREKACLSACFSWLVRTGEAGIKTNPCIGVRRNPEQKRERYVEHEEYAMVHQLASRPVRALMGLIYRTLQRPEDIIGWTRANIITKTEHDISRRILRNRQLKTGATVDMEVTPEIDSILQDLFGSNGPVVGMNIIHRRDGRPYTYDGLCAMLKRSIKKARVPTFGFYDLKGKGATDMWQAGVPLEQIQVLCGHDSVKTTEVYVKRRWRGIVMPNQVTMSV